MNAQGARWKRAALLPDRLRDAIGVRLQRGESIPELAREYAVPKAFVAALGPSGDPPTPSPRQKARPS